MIRRSLRAGMRWILDTDDQVVAGLHQRNVGPRDAGAEQQRIRAAIGMNGLVAARQDRLLWSLNPEPRLAAGNRRAPCPRRRRG